MMERRPILLDTTLRDGEQSPGVYFTHEEKLHIARTLDSLGIEIIEAGIPSMGREERQNLRALKRLGLNAEILSWNRLLIEDVVNSLKAGVPTLHVSVPTSDLMIEKKMGKKRDWIIPQMERVFSFAIERGATISFGAEDASRTDLSFLRQVFLAARDLGAKRVRFADTLGIMTPSMVSRTIRFLAQDLGIAIDFHGHNDFGMATANALSAWESGADVISCSVLGLGERAGNTSLEEFACIMQCLENRIQGFNFVALKELCLLISSWINSPISERKPIVGEKIFMHESGIHVDGLLKEPSTYEFFPPELLGESRTFVLGKHSGRKAVRYFANSEGFNMTDKLIDDFLKDMRHCMAQVRGVDASSMLNHYLVSQIKKQ
ncbi:homoaconitate hydratase [Parabacteroides sp. Marseille-P3160]|uniref:homocitrate synthase/isopropylmalate synthase family protein n=1 Tax=Parabacteroides sp. Marseille-P3160 TaxID=1917887 RepID=UPI00135C29EC|nr:homoaconitate hydratase [Parabacteroides sp. Marseille-P3160]